MISLTFYWIFLILATDVISVIFIACKQLHECNVAVTPGFSKEELSASRPGHGMYVIEAVKILKTAESRLFWIKENYANHKKYCRYG